MNIRSAEKKDLALVAHVAKTSYEDAFGEYFNFKDELEAEIQENRSEKYFESVLGKDDILVAEVDEKIIGYLQFGEPSSDIQRVLVDDIQLKRLYILASFHNRGIGSKLIDSMFAHESLSQVNNVYVEVWKQNDKAVKLYKKFGFEFTGQQRPFYEKGKIVGHDDMMVKHLS